MKNEFEDAYKVRLPLMLRERNGTIYAQLQIEVAKFNQKTACTYLEFAKFSANQSYLEIGLQVEKLLKRFHEIADLTLQEFEHLTGETVEEYKEKKSQQVINYMDAKDSNDLAHNYSECGIEYILDAQKYSFYLNFILKEGRHWYYSNSPSTGKRGILTFPEPLEFDDGVSPERLGEMVMEAFDRSRKMAIAASSEFCPPKTITLLDESELSIQAPKDRHFVDMEDNGVAEFYQVYGYFNQSSDEMPPAYFFLGIAPELDCGWDYDNIRTSWEKFYGKFEFFELREETVGIYTLRVEARNKKSHRISYFLRINEDEILECGMEIMQPNRRKKLEEKLPELLLEFAKGCRFCDKG